MRWSVAPPSLGFAISSCATVVPVGALTISAGSVLLRPCRRGSFVVSQTAERAGMLWERCRGQNSGIGAVQEVLHCASVARWSADPVYLDNGARAVARCRPEQSFSPS
jgi:hypothetical protein